MRYAGYYCNLSCTASRISFTHDERTQIFTLSLHDALPILLGRVLINARCPLLRGKADILCLNRAFPRSEEHTSELQSLRHLVCRLLLEKKKPTGPSRAAAMAAR